MPLDAAFAPYRLAPGAPPEEVARIAAQLAAEPLVAPAAERPPAGVANRALADVPCGRAPSPEEACRAADGSPAGLSGPPRACLSSERHRERVSAAGRDAVSAGFAGVHLDRPDASLALGLLGAGFCPDCLAAFGRHLSREYGSHFQPVDYLAMAREALTVSSGAIAFPQLPFGRDYWRFRNGAVDDAVRAYVRGARDASRGQPAPFAVVAQFEALGPGQLRAARHLDGAVFPGPEVAGTGIGHARLLRAAMGHRPVAIGLAAAAAGPAAPPALARLAAAMATCGVELSGLDPAGPGGAEVAAVQRLARQLAAEPGRAPALATPVAEACVLYSAEADLWTNGRHRLSVARAVETLAGVHLQSPVVTRILDAPPDAALVLADAAALAPQEAKEVRRRLEAGAAVLCFGEPAQVDEAGRPAGAFLPGGKAGGVKVGSGTVAELPPLVTEKGSPPPVDPSALQKALAALLGKGRRAAGVSGRTPLLVVLQRSGGALDVHLVSLAERAQGVTLFLGAEIAGGVRRGRFVSAGGEDVVIRLNPSGYSLSTVLPSFDGYAVLSLAT